MLRFPVSGLVVALLLVAGSTWGQAVPEPLRQVLRQYQPQPLAGSGTSVALGSRGTVQLLPQATERRTGTKDSDRGEIRLAGLLITYDIGSMAGTHVSAYNRNGDPYPGGDPTPFSAYEERAVGVLQATLGLRPNLHGGSKVVATLRAQANPRDFSAASFPANFWADVRTEAELQQFLAIVFSYQPTAKP